MLLFFIKTKTKQKKPQNEQKQNFKTYRISNKHNQQSQNRKHMFKKNKKDT